MRPSERLTQHSWSSYIRQMHNCYNSYCRMILMDFPYEHMAAFHAVAKYGSFSRAGAALLRSQSAVRVQVAKLEAALGKRLFDRTTKHVVLTEAGQILLRYSLRIDELMQQAQQELADLDQLERGRLVLCTSDTTACYRLPALLQHYRACHPGI